MSAIAEYIDGISNSETIEDAKRFLKMEFVLHHMQGMERRMFSLSDVDMNTASDFISFLIEFVLANDIPVRFSLAEKAEDIGQYVYACLVHKKCAVCGRHADLHHAEGSHVGSGFNRNEVHHLGREALPLCRAHHEEVHRTGEAEFLEKYHLEPVKLDERLCKIYKLKK
ncbi:MAG: putative HNHc nuclease [Veillonellaceae bacterium]|nr:putative HNHc nuclease [Veillonellaceae bacterium]